MTVGPFAGRRPLRRLGQDDEAGGVVRLVLHVLGEDLQAVDVGRQPRRERRAGSGPPLGHLARGARGVAGHMRLEPELADDLAALAERMDVAVHGLDRAEIGLGCAMSWKWIGRKCSPTMCSPEVGRRWWMSATRPAIEFSIGIMARARRALVHRREGILEGRAGQRLPYRDGVPAGDVGIGARLALERNDLAHVMSSAHAR